MLNIIKLKQEWRASRLWPARPRAPRLLQCGAARQPRHVVAHDQPQPRPALGPQRREPGRGPVRLRRVRQGVRDVEQLPDAHAVGHEHRDGLQRGVGQVCVTSFRRRTSTVIYCSTLL